MVYLALTPQGLQEILDTAELAEVAVWCSADAISGDAFENLDRGNITRFLHPLADAATVRNALWTIADHHPGERIWIESVPVDQ